MPGYANPYYPYQQSYQPPALSPMPDQLAQYRQQFQPPMPMQTPAPQMQAQPQQPAASPDSDWHPFRHYRRGTPRRR